MTANLLAVSGRTHRSILSREKSTRPPSRECSSTINGCVMYYIIKRLDHNSSIKTIIQIIIINLLYEITKIFIFNLDRITISCVSINQDIVVMDVRHISRRISIGKELLLILDQDRDSLENQLAIQAFLLIADRGHQVGVIGIENGTVPEVGNDDGHVSTRLEHSP